MKTPTSCASGTCQSTLGPHCAECDHAEWEGRAVVRDLYGQREYRWTYRNAEWPAFYNVRTGRRIWKPRPGLRRAFEAWKRETFGGDPCTP